jgi:hypothetical protein
MSLNAIILEMILERIGDFDDQKEKSAGTSLNQVASAIKQVSSKGIIKPDHVVTDVGGGKYDKGVAHIKDTTGANASVFDPFNRSQEHNDKVEKQNSGKSDHVFSNNVGNVIKEKKHLVSHLKQCKSFMKPASGSKFHFSVYTGDSSGNGRMTQKDQSWQHHKKLNDPHYQEAMHNVFPESEYDHSIKNGVHTVTKK